MQSILESIRRYIAENILFEDTYPYPDETSFLEEGIVDSMNVLELVSFVEEHFGIPVADEDIVPENFDSVANMAAYVARVSAVAD
ncbi:MAG: acyl carrier protein [Anaerolineae bacterium]|nr:MAG: acyl carrier protein [Anaerolineae bacterium]